MVWIGICGTAYDALSEYIITDIAGGTAVNIADRLKQYEELPLMTIAGGKYGRKRILGLLSGPDSLQETVLELFYQEI